MRKLILFMHVSLDGFVAGLNGEMDWIHVDEEIFEYVGERVSESDTALYGRVTYEMMEAYWPTAADKPGATKHDKDHSRWYKNATKIVLTRSPHYAKRENTIFIGDDVNRQMTQLKSGEGKDIIMFGSPTAAHFLVRDGFVDAYWLFFNPVLLGKGIPLFEDIGEMKKLKSLSATNFKSGVVCIQAV